MNFLREREAKQYEQWKNKTSNQDKRSQTQKLSRIGFATTYVCQGLAQSIILQKKITTKEFVYLLDLRTPIEKHFDLILLPIYFERKKEFSLLAANLKQRLLIVYSMTEQSPKDLVDDLNSDPVINILLKLFERLLGTSFQYIVGQNVRTSKRKLTGQHLAYCVQRIV